MRYAVAVLALLAGAEPSRAPDPCRAAGAPLPAIAGVAPSDLVPVEEYRAAWRRACHPSARPADLAALLGDAEALTADVSTSPVLEAIAASLGPAAQWPLPAIRRREAEPLEVDWEAFGAVAGRGTAEDARFWRAAALAAGPLGEPAWFGDRVQGRPDRCLRLAEVRWLEVADALDAMERGGAGPYVRHARALRSSLVDALGSLARGRAACACLPGDGAAALEPLAAEAAAERLGTPGRRAVVKAAGEAVAALRSGRVRVLALRTAPGAPATGCAP